MCYFMGIRVSRGQIIRLKQIEKELGTLAAIEAFKDGFKYGDSPVIRKKEDDDIEVVNMHWEFIAHWVKTMAEMKQIRRQGIPWLNATCEKLLDSKMFRDATLNRRCLVPASYFFENRHYKPEGAKKDLSYPYVIELTDTPLFYMAGIWQPWTDKETGETMDTFAIVTTKANELLTDIHNSRKRQPTILPEDMAWEWIMEDLSEERIKEIAYFQLPSENFSAHTIPKEFKILEDPTVEFDYEELPPLDVNI